MPQKKKNTHGPTKTSISIVLYKNLEKKTIYTTATKAQQCSISKSLILTKQLKKLILSEKVIKI